MKKFLKDDSGFTLVELMVVVAIISILSTIAIPNFKKFQAKAKTSEAKLHLSSIYSAEVAFLSDADVYATCLRDMGYDPAAQKMQRYFTTGFNESLTTAENLYSNDGKINGVSCFAKSDQGGIEVSGFAAGKKTGGKEAITVKNLQGTAISNLGEKFEAAAQGWISPSYIKNNSASLTPILNAIVGQAYAADDKNTEGGSNTNTLHCEGMKGTPTGGSSLFTINEEKSLVPRCNGY